MSDRELPHSPTMPAYGVCVKISAQKYESGSNNEWSAEFTTVGQGNAFEPLADVLAAAVEKAVQLVLGAAKGNKP